MKKTLLSLALITLFGVVAVANPIKKETKEVKTSESNVTWKGYKVGVPTLEPLPLNPEPCNLKAKNWSVVNLWWT